MDNVTHAFYDFCMQYGLKQHVSSPTKGSNVLDLIFTQDHINFISNVNISAPVRKSDHSSISFSISWPINSYTTPVTKRT